MPRSLLLADDSITMQKVVAITFANEDFTIAAVDNGEDAIAKARELRPDIVVADVVMPGMSGYEVCEALKSDPETRHIPVLLLAGTFEEFDDERARSVQADGHISKPFESAAFIEAVRRLIGEGSAGAPAPSIAPPAPAAQQVAPRIPSIPIPAGIQPLPPLPSTASRPSAPISISPLGAPAGASGAGWPLPPLPSSVPSAAFSPPASPSPSAPAAASGSAWPLPPRSSSVPGAASSPASSLPPGAPSVASGSAWPLSPLPSSVPGAPSAASGSAWPLPPAPTASQVSPGAPAPASESGWPLPPAPTASHVSPVAPAPSSDAGWPLPPAPTASHVSPVAPAPSSDAGWPLPPAPTASHLSPVTPAPASDAGWPLPPAPTASHLAPGAPAPASDAGWPLPPLPRAAPATPGAAAPASGGGWRLPTSAPDAPAGTSGAGGPPSLRSSARSVTPGPADVEPWFPSQPQAPLVPPPAGQAFGTPAPFDEVQATPRFGFEAPSLANPARGGGLTEFHESRPSTLDAVPNPVSVLQAQATPGPIAEATYDESIAWGTPIPRSPPSARAAEPDWSAAIPDIDLSAESSYAPTAAIPDIEFSSGPATQAPIRPRFAVDEIELDEAATSSTKFDEEIPVDDDPWSVDETDAASVDDFAAMTDLEVEEDLLDAVVAGEVTPVDLQAGVLGRSVSMPSASTSPAADPAPLHVPIVGASTPSIAAITPSVAAPTPSVAAITPSVAAHTPSVAAHTPSVAAHTPSVAAHTPSVAAPTPSVAAITPSVAAPRPSVAAPTPSVAARSVDLLEAGGSLDAEDLPRAPPVGSSGHAALEAALSGASSEIIERISWEVVPQLAESLLRERVAAVSRDVIEKIVWEVVPQLAETIIRRELDRLIRERRITGS